jgi:hypothetical protein
MTPAEKAHLVQQWHSLVPAMEGLAVVTVIGALICALCFRRLLFVLLAALAAFAFYLITAF